MKSGGHVRADASSSFCHCGFRFGLRRGCAGRDWTALRSLAGLAGLIFFGRLDGLVRHDGIARRMCLFQGIYRRMMRFIHGVTGIRVRESRCFIELARLRLRSGAALFARIAGGKWCGREDSNFHEISPTATSTLRVYQFRHDRISPGNIL